jgi:hypothetical protein
MSAAFSPIMLRLMLPTWARLSMRVRRPGVGPWPGALVWSGAD